jgi:hypothetical protein
MGAGRAALGACSSSIAIAPPTIARASARCDAGWRARRRPASRDGPGSSWPADHRSGPRDATAAWRGGDARASDRRAGPRALAPDRAAPPPPRSAPPPPAAHQPPAAAPGARRHDGRSWPGHSLHADRRPRASRRSLGGSPRTRFAASRNRRSTRASSSSRTSASLRSSQIASCARVTAARYSLVEPRDRARRLSHQAFVLRAGSGSTPNAFATSCASSGRGA